MVRISHSLLLPGLMALGLIGLFLPFWLFMPLLFDQQMYMYVAKAILAGGAPYVDAWEQKGPLLHVIYASVMAMGGVHEFSIRLFDTALTLGALMLIFLLARSSGQPRLGLIAVILAMLFTPLTGASMAQADSWSAYTGIAIAFILLSGSNPTRSAFAAGVLQGACLMFKPTTALFGLAALVRARYEQDWLHFLLIYAAGASIIPVLVLLWLASHGALDAFWQDFIVFNISQHGADGINKSAFFLETLSFPYINSIARMVYLPLAVFGWWKLRKSSNRLADMTGAITLAGLIAYEVQGLYAISHAVPVLLPASLLVAAAINVQPIWALLLIFQLPHVFGSSGYKTFDSWRYALGHIDRTTYVSLYDFPNYKVATLIKLAERIKILSPENSPIYVYSFEPSPYIYANRSAPTRYFVNYPLNKGTAAQLEQTRIALMHDLEARPPYLIIVTKFDVNNLQPVPSYQHYLKFNSLNTFVEQRYTLAEDTAEWVIYKQR